MVQYILIFILYLYECLEKLYQQHYSTYVKKIQKNLKTINMYIIRANCSHTKYTSKVCIGMYQSVLNV